MDPHQPFRAGFFATLANADRAIAALLASGFDRDRLAVICPEPFHDEIIDSIPRAEPPTRHAPEQIVEGGLIGAALGGIALVATSFATGSLGLVSGALVLVGGGAIAGSFARLVVDDGYQCGVGEYYSQALANHQIVIGVYVAGDHVDVQLAQAMRIFKDAGAVSIAPDDDPTKHLRAESFNSGADNGVLTGI